MIMQNLFLEENNFIIYTDGASRGNPGEAGIGVVIKTKDNKNIKVIRKYIGKTTNNQAEYTALLYALREIVKNSPEIVNVFCDSELMVKQINGEYRVKDLKIKPLYNEAITLISKIKNFKIEHVRREYNKEADVLANEAIDNKELYK